MHFVGNMDAGNLPTGVYFCRLMANDVARTTKMLMLR